MHPDRQAKILIVDDDPVLVEAMRVVLEAKRYEVVSAGDAREGWKKAAAEEPDLIILDVMMEKLDSGFVLCQRLKRDVRYRHIPVLILTAVDREFHLRLGDDTGDEEWLPGDAYLGKPVEPSRLLAETASLLKYDHSNRQRGLL